MKYTIDARDKKIGRIASEAVAILMGKNSVSFAKNKVIDSKVEIISAGRVDVTARKKDAVIHVTYTGHRGGLNSEKLGDLIVRKGMTGVLEQAIRRMLPDNKLRDRRMKNLIIKE